MHGKTHYVIFTEMRLTLGLAEYRQLEPNSGIRLEFGLNAEHSMQEKRENTYLHYLTCIVTVIN